MHSRQPTSDGYARVWDSHPRPRAIPSTTLKPPGSSITMGAFHKEVHLPLRSGSPFRILPVRRGATVAPLKGLRRIPAGTRHPRLPGAGGQLQARRQGTGLRHGEVNSPSALRYQP